MTFKGRRLVLDIPKLTAWRAPTDNDGTIKKEWIENYYDVLKTHVYKTSIVRSNKKSIVMDSNFSLGGFSHFPVLAGTLRWTVYGDGEIELSMTATFKTKFPYMPRLGIQWFLDEKYNQVQYFGYGPYESYIDKHHASHVSRFAATVEEMHEDYIKPQENGSHYQTRWACITSINGEGILFAGEPDFSFNVSAYTPEMLTKAMHPYELAKSGYTVVHTDYMMSGVGSGSCGPQLSPLYQMNHETIAFRLHIRPLDGSEDILSMIRRKKTADFHPDGKQIVREEFI